MFFVLSILRLSTFGQTYALKDFVESQPPKPGSPENYRLNNSLDHDFSVAIIDGKLQVSKHTYETHNYNIPQGQYIPYDRGEFGGELYYRPNDPLEKDFYINGKYDSVRNDPFSKNRFSVPKESPANEAFKRTLLIKSGHVKFILKYQDSVYLIEGLSHMGFAYGAIFNISLKYNLFSYNKTLSFENESPNAAAILGKDLLISTDTNFYIIHDWKKELILNNLFWQILYPNSIAVKDNKHVYVGMRGGYADINLIKKTLLFYQYNK
jgi:hypothetical protein